MYKQAIVVRADLKLPKGKLAVQAAHASLDAAQKVSKEILGEWSHSGAKKNRVKS